jgi:enamine deaminase RidA (YjgF/YER057c/UK114 family)/GNAT superfamily N-acetyltransferase
MTLTIEPAGAADAETVALLVRELCAHHGQDSPFGAATMQDHGLARGDFEVLLARQGGKPVGYALFCPSYETDYAARGVYLADLYVRPDARRQGIGRALVAAVARLGRQRDLSFLWWTSQPWNEDGHAFYKALGGTHEPVVAHALIFGAFEALAAAAPANREGIMSIEARLTELGIELPPQAPAAGNYVHAVLSGNHLYLAGKGPMGPDGTFATGVVGAEVPVEEAYKHARLVGLQLIRAMKDALGDLDRVQRIVKVLGMVRATPGFGQQPEVINGCSDLFVEVFGERGRHARSAVGMGSLPRGITVEIEAIVEVA